MYPNQFNFFQPQTNQSTQIPGQQQQNQMIQPQFQYPYPQPSYQYINPYQSSAQTPQPTQITPPQVQMPTFYPMMYMPPYPNPHMMMPMMPFQFAQNMNFGQQINNVRGFPQPLKKKPEYDPKQPENSREEILKWIEERKKNYPSKKNQQRKQLEQREKEESGELTEPKLSVLEKKLRKRVNLMNSLDKKINRRKEYEKRNLLNEVIYPFSNRIYEKEDNDRHESQGANTKHPNISKKDYSQSRQQSRFRDKIEQKERKKDNSMNILAEFHQQIENIEMGTTTEAKKDDDAPIMVKGIKKSRFTDTPEPVPKPSPDPTPKASFNPTPKVSVEKVHIKTEVNEDTEIEQTKQAPIDIIKKLKQKKNQEDNQIQMFMDGKKPGDYRYKSNTLLAKLLIDSIYNERSVILQCFRYITKEKFFDS